MNEKKRTLKQNSALHLYFEHLADELNSHGFEMKAVMAIKEVDVPWSKETVKEVIWRPLMQAQLGKKSTKDMTTKDIDKVFDTITRHLGERLGLTVSFPSIETQLNE